MSSATVWWPVYNSSATSSALNMDTKRYRTPWRLQGLWCLLPYSAEFPRRRIRPDAKFAGPWNAVESKLIIRNDTREVVDSPPFHPFKNLTHSRQQTGGSVVLSKELVSVLYRFNTLMETLSRPEPFFSFLKGIASHNSFEVVSRRPRTFTFCPSRYHRVGWVRIAFPDCLQTPLLCPFQCVQNLFLYGKEKTDHSGLSISRWNFSSKPFWFDVSVPFHTKNGQGPLFLAQFMTPW